MTPNGAKISLLRMYCLNCAAASVGGVFCWHRGDTDLGMAFFIWQLFSIVAGVVVHSLVDAAHRNLVLLAVVAVMMALFGPFLPSAAFVIR